MTQCGCCKQFFSSEIIRYDSCDEQSKCPKCYRESHFICTSCDEEYHIDYKVSSKHISEDTCICEDCESEFFDDCIQCNESDYIDKGIIVEQGFLCSDCAKTEKAECSICGRLIWKNSTKKTGCSMCKECNTQFLYYQYVSTEPFYEKPSFHITLYDLKRKPTELLMSRLRHSYGDSPTNEKYNPFDVLLIDHLSFSFVVIYNPSKAWEDLSCCLGIMSKFKERRDSWWIADEIRDNSSLIHWPNNQDFYMWQRPYRIMARTASDTDYGDHWENGVCVKKGDRYGNTSNFYIIGTLRRRGAEL